MKKESEILRLYAQHYKKSGSIQFNTHGFRYDVRLLDPHDDTIDNERGHYVHAYICFKGQVVGVIYIDNNDGTFTNYRLVLNGLDLCYNSIPPFCKERNLKHETVQGCIDEIERIRCYIVDYLTT
jgi:hypothetical protein